tara:strand:- start:1511 stop:1897 length:387 start_codon:yes stop_codon:yes gene_type:complete
MNNKNILKMDFDNDKLCLAVKWYIENCNVVKIYSARYLIKYRASRPIPKTDLQKKLNKKSFQTVKESVMIDYAVQLLNIRMLQFARWFKYMMGKQPELNLKTAERLKLKYPYKTTGFGRCIKILLPLS